MAVSLDRNKYRRTQVGTVGTSKVTHALAGGSSYYLSGGMALACGRYATGVESWRSGRSIAVMCKTCRKGM